MTLLHTFLQSPSPLLLLYLYLYYLFYIYLIHFYHNYYIIHTRIHSEDTQQPVQQVLFKL